MQQLEMKKRVVTLAIAGLAAATAIAWAPVQTSKTGPNTAIKLVVAPEGNTARYRVREQLVGVDLPNDAVGETNNVTGAIAFDAKGNLVVGESKIIVNVTDLKSDKARRDGYVKNRLLSTSEYPTVEFVPTQVRGVKFPLPKSGKQQIELTGNLTVRGVTRVTTWRGDISFDNGKVVGRIATTFTFDEFNMTKPKVPVVLSVEDSIKLEYDFTLLPAP